MTGRRQTRWAAPMKAVQRARRSAEAHPPTGGDRDPLYAAYARLLSAHARARKQGQQQQADQHLGPAIDALNAAADRITQRTTTRR